MSSWPGNSWWPTWATPSPATGAWRLVVSGAAGQSAAFSVQRNLPESDYFQDGRTDGSVDVILTGDFKELTGPELVDQTPGKLSCPRESRRIVDDAKWPVIPKAG